ncbi:hypothetical protein [Thaumasiovibrio subtropicus]|uniref:hypothetical protein n=1 Tax=Thaumasiovibrio subtropicus TaxID=1891207 RepID=UPI000B35D10A|nr:hypothetical protein [Thaumasiovibrio subtropicus]
MESLLLLFLPMAVGALYFITLCLFKGEICPGQRGRLHKWLPAVLIPFALSIPGSVMTLIPMGLIAAFCFQVKTGKTRVEGPRILLVLAAATSIAVWIAVAMGHALPVILISALCTPLLGAAFAHLLMTVARTRLQAFHRLLPVLGIVSAMVMMMLWLWFWKVVLLEEIVVANALLCLLALVIAVLLWVLHMFKATAPSKRQLSAVNFLILFALLNHSFITF